MITSLDSYVAAVDEIFKKDLTCYLRREYYSMLINIPKEIEIVNDARPIAAGYIGKDRYVTRTESSQNDDWIIETLFGVPKVTMDEVMNPDLNLDSPYIVNISVADMAELVYKRAVVNLLRPVEVALVYDRCRIYLNSIRDYSLYDLHFQSPPQEDIDAIRRLKDIVEPLANIYNQTGNADTFMSRLLGMSRKTMSSTTTKDKVAIEINGITNGFELNDPFKNNPNLYQFANY